MYLVRSCRRPLGSIDNEISQGFTLTVRAFSISTAFCLARVILRASTCQDHFRELRERLESAEDGKHFPSDLAKSGAIKKTPDSFTYIDPAQFHELFAADLSGDQAAFMARSQVVNFADNFSATITTAAGRTKPSWMLVTGSDRTINPDLERWYAKRAKSQTVEVAGANHSVYVSHPKEVADVIKSAARAVSK
jgi:pimeloyl-ACP methyl ester carboxylesterase